MRIEEARALFENPADGEILLADLLQRERTWIFSHPRETLSNEQIATITGLAERRKRGEPIAYLRGKQSFFGRDFRVTNDTLIPRPATEGLVSLALEWIEKPLDVVRAIDAEIVGLGFALNDADAKTIVDIGTGSGCIAITLKLERPDLRVIATDLSKGALTVASDNAKRLNAQIDFRSGDALDAISDLQEPFLIVSNPPYVPADVTLMKDVADFEPSSALFAGEKGMDVIKRMMTQAKEHPFCCGVLLECRSDQVIEITKLLHR